jgi:hypothetical protein
LALWAVTGLPLTIGVLIAAGVPLSPWPLVAYDGLRDWPVVGYRIEALAELDWTPKRLSGLAFIYCVITFAAIASAVFLASWCVLNPRVKARAASKQESISPFGLASIAGVVCLASYFAFWGPVLEPDSLGRYPLSLMAIADIGTFHLFMLVLAFFGPGLPILACNVIGEEPVDL